MFGYVEQSKPQQGGNYGKFGLNQNVEFVKFAFNPNGGQGGSAKECIDFHFKVGEQEFRHRFFVLENGYENNTLKPLSNFIDKELSKRIFNTWQENILNIARCFVSDEDLKKYLVGERVANFRAFASTLEQLIKKNPKQTTKLDVFLEWQKKISPNQDKTFLTFAINEGQVNDGICVTEHIEGDFKEIKDDKGLKYVTEDGKEHPISRGAYYFRDANKKKERQELNKSNSVGSEDTTNPFGADSFDDLPFA